MKNFCKKTLQLSALGVALTTCFATSVHAQPDMGPTEKLKTEIGNNFDRLFMIHAAMGNMAEVKLGNLALKKSKNPAVHMVAKTTIKGHGDAQKALAMHFRTMNIPMPADAGPANVALYEKLSRLSGPAFDKLYMAQQVGAHEATITLFEHEIENGKNQTAKMHAMNTLPHILMHTSMIYDTAVRVKAPGANIRPRQVIEAAMDAHAAMKH